MQLVKSEKFGNVQCNFYSDEKEVWLTREQIGKALEYLDPHRAIYKLHKRHKDRLDKLSVVTKLTTTDGKAYETYIYNAKGVYEICRWSRQPKADAFMDFVWKVIESLRKGEMVLVNKYKLKEMSIKARYMNAKTRQAKLIADIAERFKDKLSSESVQALVACATETLTGAPIIDKPKTERLYTATEIANEIGTSANMVGRVSNKNNLKTNDYGIWVLDKSPYSSKQIPNFQYNEAGRRKLKELFSN